MKIIAGISLKGIKPRVWDKTSNYYLSELQGVMISYADFYTMPKRRKEAMEQGIHEALGIPKKVEVYLDNGAFYFLKRQEKIPSAEEYEEFVQLAKPDWYPIPQDFIPTPKMTVKEQKKSFERTMEMNFAYKNEPQYVPVIHIGQFMEEYINQIKSDQAFMKKSILH